eukprot:TRINITY_DN5998_c0_g1_i13.p1 TRINITY_DN5998_c0_g1~~TRINITY_DN5998_c0_g1_i13.p1  ORF type:complete len:240 (+),score=42.27 TRINITY_DN5998_c0_g1_i13:99-818(+)
MIRRPPRSTLSSSSAASDVYKRQVSTQSTGARRFGNMAEPETSSQNEAVEDTAFRLVTWNVWFGQLEAEKRLHALLAEVAEHSPTVVCLQEVTPWFHAAMAVHPSVKDTYFCAVAPSGSYDVAIWVRMGMELYGCHVIDIPSGMDRRCVVADIGWPGQDLKLRVATVHLESIKFNSQMRLNQSGKFKQVRFDRVLTIQGMAGARLEPKAIELLGTQPIAGLNEIWPSDHFGLVTHFEIA